MHHYLCKPLRYATLLIAAPAAKLLPFYTFAFCVLCGYAVALSKLAAKKYFYSIASLTLKYAMEGRAVELFAAFALLCAAVAATAACRTTFVLSSTTFMSKVKKVST